MQDSINTMISNALIVNKDILSKNIKPIINQIKIALERNKEAILQANNIDQKNNNGFIIDFNIINNIFCNLETVILEEGVTNLRKNAFYNNSNLREVYLPDSLKYIDKNAFTKCSNLLIICNKNTLAEKFAIDNKLMIKYRKD